MQPYFFPYLGYYSLIKHTDEWIFLDVVQFIRHGWIERNRILKPVEGWQYIGVPLQKHSRNTLIKDIHISGAEDWKNKIVRQLEHYKKAPYYEKAIGVIKQAINIETDSITRLNAHILKITCTYLDIFFSDKIFSEMNLEIKPVEQPGDWALHISEACSATEYINPFGGIDLFDRNAFKESGIQLCFLKNNLKTYSQRRPFFEPGLSIVDVMMFNSKTEIQAMIDDIEIIRA